MKKGFFNGLFDLNRDGKLDSFERAMDFMAFEELINEDETDSDDEWDDECDDDF